jgi:hypothetical protein
MVTGNKAKLILYTDDTSFTIVTPIPMDCTTNVNETHMAVTTWFKNQQLSLNLDKTTYLQFHSKNSQQLDFNISLSKDQISKSKTKFFGLLIDEKLSWKGHVTH